jgi:hypothetical protein
VQLVNREGRDDTGQEEDFRPLNFRYEGRYFLEEHLQNRLDHNPCDAKRDQ